MKRVLPYLSMVAIAGGLAIVTMSSAGASSVSSVATLPNMSLPGAGVTPAHCRPYWHCERICKRRWYGKKKCRVYCHSC
jgi:hypothetical protein